MCDGWIQWEYTLQKSGRDLVYIVSIHQSPMQLMTKTHESSWIIPDAEDGWFWLAQTVRQVRSIATPYLLCLDIFNLYFVSTLTQHLPDSAN